MMTPHENEGQRTSVRWQVSITWFLILSFLLLGATQEGRKLYLVFFSIKVPNCLTLHKKRRAICCYALTMYYFIPDIRQDSCYIEIAFKTLQLQDLLISLTSTVKSNHHTSRHRNLKKKLSIPAQLWYLRGGETLPALGDFTWKMLAANCLTVFHISHNHFGHGVSNKLHFLNLKGTTSFDTWEKVGILSNFLKP